MKPQNNNQPNEHIRSWWLQIIRLAICLHFWHVIFSLISFGCRRLFLSLIEENSESEPWPLFKTKKKENSVRVNMCVLRIVRWALNRIPSALQWREWRFNVVILKSKNRIIRTHSILKISINILDRCAVELYFPFYFGLFSISKFCLFLHKIWNAPCVVSIFFLIYVLFICVLLLFIDIKIYITWNQGKKDGKEMIAPSKHTKLCFIAFHCNMNMKFCCTFSIVAVYCLRRHTYPFKCIYNRFEEFSTAFIIWTYQF